MAQYTLFKMEHMKFHKKLKRNDFVKVRMALRAGDLSLIRNEVLAHPQQTDWAYNGVVQDQVLNFRVIHHDVRTMAAEGTPYLHNWLNALVDRLFLQKNLYELFYFRTPRVFAPGEWIPCPFHVDLDGAPVEWQHQNLHDRAPISIYIPVGENELSLDIKFKKYNRGPRRKHDTTRVTLQPGDVLFFNTASCAHRSAEPVAGSTTPDRVYIVLSGFQEVMELDPPAGEPEADDVSIGFSNSVTV